MTSNRVRKHPAYAVGRDCAEGYVQGAIPGIMTRDGEEAFRAGFNDRKAEIERDHEHHRQQTEDLSTLLYEAQREQDFDKLCVVVERLIGETQCSDCSSTPS